MSEDDFLPRARRDDRVNRDSRPRSNAAIGKKRRATSTSTSATTGSLTTRPQRKLIRQILSDRPLGEREDRARVGRGGWVSDDIKVLPGEPATLSCPYWGSDGGRTFDILVDDKKLATQTVDGNAPGKSFDVQYKIPEEMSKGKKKVTVKFQAQAKGVAGGIFGIAMLKGH